VGCRVDVAFGREFEGQGADWRYYGHAVCRPQSHSVSPVARSTGHAGRALAVSAVAIGLMIAIAIGLALLASRGTVEVRLGDETFGGQRAERLAAEIDRDGPILYPDVAAGDRDIMLQHLGDDPERGWFAFAARPEGTSRDCTVRWDSTEEVFRLLDPDGEVREPCDGQEFPADGTGLPQYPVAVRDGRLDVDLNAAQRETSTTR